MTRCLLTSDNFLTWHCPGCNSGHGVPVVGTNAWGWNYSTENPTLTPSVLVHPHPRHEKPPQVRCHCYVTEGKIMFLSDCGHALAGQTVEMEDTEA